MKSRVLEGGVVEAIRPGQGGYSLILRAKNIRPRNTGTYAEISLLVADPQWDKDGNEQLPLDERKHEHFLASDDLNIKKEPGTLLRTARKRAGDKADLPMGPQEDALKLERDFNNWCSHVWEDMASFNLDEEVPGDPTLPVEYIAKPHVLDGQSGTILYGEQGDGKSLTALVSLIAVDAGLNGFWETNQRNGLFVNLERSSSSIARRIGCINIALGLPHERPLRCINRRGYSLSSIEPQIRHLIRKHNIGYVVVDSISRMGQGDLNDNQTANQTMDMLNSIECSWMALGHMGRSEKRRLFGSTMYDAGADIMLRLTSARNEEMPGQDAELGVKLEVTKANDIAWPAPMVLGYKFDTYGLTAMRRASEDDFPKFAEMAELRLDKEIERFLFKHGPSNATHLANSLNKDRSQVSKILNNSDNFTGRRIGREVEFSVKYTGVKNA